MFVMHPVRFIIGRGREAAPIGIASLRQFLFPGGLALLLLCGALSPAHAVAQWARLYGMTCEGCHAPYPRLNAVGQTFKLNGYRFTLGERAKITERNVLNYIGPTWSPVATVGDSTRGTAFGNTVKIHIGGPVGSYTGFLVQPTPGAAADFNMIQGLVAFGSKKDSFRVVGGRIYAWANGGGIGASDRYATATVPLALNNLHGITAGGLGNGARLEYNITDKASLAVFSSDMEAASVKSQVFGVSLARLLDSKTASAVELFAAHGDVPISGASSVSGWRYGLFANRVFADKKGREPFNLLGGILAGSDSRAVRAGLPTDYWTGFLELDWTPSNTVTWLARQDWENGAVASGGNSATTLGAAVQLNKYLRFDSDLVVHAPGIPSPRMIFRFRLVY